jgi:predicted ATPase
LFRSALALWRGPAFPDLGVAGVTPPELANGSSRCTGRAARPGGAAAQHATLLARLDSRLKLLRGGHADVPTHQQTLRGTIAWSYDLLASSERSVFTRCAVLAGGGTLEAIEAVCAPVDAEAVGVLDTLDALVSQSLVLRRESVTSLRFWMLQTIRDFALELLGASQAEPVTRARHATFYRSFAEAAAVGLGGPQQSLWLA